jgi:hypothetical protein
MEVFARVVTGMLKKQIGAVLGIGEKTVKVHRARVMEKMEAASVAELVRLADEAGVTVPKTADPLAKFFSSPPSSRGIVVGVSSRRGSQRTP